MTIPDASPDTASVRIPQMHALFGPLFADAGLPPGCLQILNSSEQDVADHTEQLIAHPSVRVRPSPAWNPKNLIKTKDGQLHWIGETGTDTGCDVWSVS